MPEGSRRGSQRSPSNSAAKRPSSVSSSGGIVGRMMSAGERGASSSSCTSVNTVCSDGGRPLSSSSSTSSVSSQDASHSSSSSSSSSSLPYGAVPTYNASSSSSAPKRNGSDISSDLTPLVTPPGAATPTAGGRLPKMATAASPAPNGHITNPVAAMPAGATPRQSSRSERVISEIVETEQTYVRDSKSIVEDYSGCIIDCGALPSKPEQVSTSFCNIEDIFEFNSDSSEDLERSPDAAAIAECFSERSEAFDIYTSYCMNYPNSVAVLRECMKNGSSVRFFQERQTTSNHSLPSETYSLKPVQRILKYHSSSQELSKHVDKSDPGYEVVEDAIVTMTAVAWYINDMKRKQEHAVRSQEIESSSSNWSGPDSSGFGESVSEGSFKVSRVKKERAFFSFDTMSSIAKKRSERFVYSTHIFCCNLQSVETSKDPSCFKVWDQTIGKQQHVVQTKNQEEKRSWVHYSKRSIVENHPASLPQKARQVLGDNFCQSPQFDQENSQKSCASPRSDDLHSFHRGRRQSEPPESSLYTPEKSRRGSPSSSEGTSPYRRTRRQSAPAKDIEAAFHPGAASKTGSEGELCPADGSGSADSSTSASSVIEVETERSSPRVKSQSGEEEDEEEESSTLRSPPTLSITEEISEFINQSRVREGFSSMNQTQAPPTDIQTPPTDLQTPPTNLQTPPCKIHEPPFGLQDPPIEIQAPPTEIQAPPTVIQAPPTGIQAPPTVIQAPPTGIQAPASPACCSADSLEPEQEGEDMKKQLNTQDPAADGERISGEVLDVPGEVEETVWTRSEKEDERRPDETKHTLEIPPSSDLQLSILSELQKMDTEPAVSPQGPDPFHQPIQRFQTPKKVSNLTKKDKKIIEKIRSYYEAAAEAEEDEAEDEEEQSEGVRTRRGSFSQIPSGLVKESVSRFTVSGHQREPNTESRSGSSTDPPPDGDVEEPDPENPAQWNSKDPSSQTEENPDPEPRTFPEEEPEEEEPEEVSDMSWNIYRGSSEEPEGTNVDEKPSDGERSTPAETQPDIDESGPGPTEPSEQESRQTTKQNRIQSTWSSTQTGDRAGTSQNSERFPSQSKVGRWSRHSRIVSANRASFEGMGSDVTGIGLFEANPVVDPVLMENSERISSKVQTSARMYSAKASTMKVPSHHKRASTIRTQAWLSARSSGNSAQNRDRSPPRSGAQAGSENKKEPRPWKGTSQNQIRTMTQEKPETRDGRPEPQTDHPKKRVWPGHVTSARDQQNHGSGLSRPRDFICSSRTPAEPPTSSNQACSSGTTAPSPPGPAEYSRTQRVERSGGCSGFSESPGSEPEEQQEADRLEKDDGRVSAQPPVLCVPQNEASIQNPDSDGPQRDDVGRDQDGADGGGSIQTPSWSRTSQPSPPGMTGEPYQREKWANDETGPVRSPGWQDTVGPSSSAEPGGSSGEPLVLPSESVSVEPTNSTTTAEALQESQDEVPTSPCSDPRSSDSSDEVQRASAVPWTISSSTSEHRRPDEPVSGWSVRTSSPVSSVFKPSLVCRSPSPLRFASSVAATSCSSPFGIIPATSPPPPSPAGFTSASSCLSPTPSSVSCGKTQTPSRGPPPSPAPPSTLHSPTSSSSAFTRSLAASHISQSISQSISRQQAPTMNPSVSAMPDSRRRTPSPNPHHLQSSGAKDQPRCPPSSLRTTCSSPSSSPRPSFLHSKAVSPQLGKKNSNNNNNAVSNGGPEPHQSHYPSWSGSHNRVARPFSASEPSSRVQSPTPSPTPAAFVRLCSPPPQHNYSSPMAHKPPHPRGSRVGGAHNHSDLRSDLPRAPFDGDSPRILSPPPIGVPVWTNNVAAPQPRNPRRSASPSLCPSTSSGPQTFRISSQTVRRPLSSTSADRPSSPARGKGSGSRHSWADLSQRSVQQESCPISPSSRWSSNSGSPSCLSPRAGSQSPLSPIRFTPGKSASSGQHFTSVPWPDVRELSTKYNGTESPETSVTPTAPESPVHSVPSLGSAEGSAEWGDPEPEEGSCRSQSICAYVARPSHQPTVSSSSSSACSIFSSPPPESQQHNDLQVHRRPQSTTSPPATPTPSRSSPSPKQGNQKASYATTVNLQIAGSGRITSFSTAQVSLTQTSQGGAGPPGSQEVMARRVSINGSSPVPQRINRS